MQKEAAAAEQSSDLSCWLCGRTSSEISSALSGETEDEVNVVKEIASIKTAKENLASNAAKWRDAVPEPFKEFDLAFVLQNADQFKSIQFLNDLVETARNTVRELDEVSLAVRKGAPVTIGGSPADESHRESIASRLNDFEKRTNRKLKREQDLRDVEYQRLGYIARLSGMKLVEGIDYLKDAGTLYYDLKLEAGERARVAATNRKPMWKVRLIKFKDFPKEIAICNVCERILKEFHPGRETG